MTIRNLKALAAQGVSAWQASMPLGATLGAVVPDAERVFFTVVCGDQGAFVQVPAWEMTVPVAWEAAAAHLLNLIQDNRLRPLEDGRVPLEKWIVPTHVPVRGAAPDQGVDLAALLPDERARWAVAAALEDGEAHLELHGEVVWFAEPRYGSLVPLAELNYDEELGLVDQRVFPAEHI
ncbi:hypothetical protein LAJ19_19995 (plasmid) [Deinococcus taeanensis]|uniref:hypothetical protein n=1 Tax=Deinococcus taeanensis TaxID=2737050 RepID=UPI001CDBA517|nr:hypothetical protein [Deinococcus taeanensis]UBV45416.1 hypothetical protein LAJ19_19995 [Deinococcus taeanensis]